MNNPFIVGEAIGVGFVLALIAYVVARKLCGPAGARHLARLNRIAGEDVQENRVSLYARDWLPYAAAVLAAFVGAMFSFVKAGAFFQRSFSSADLPELASGFKTGCERSCAAQRDAAFCERLCDCTFARLRERHPGDDAFASWMQAGPQNVQATRAEVLNAQNACLRVPEPSPAAPPQPAAIAQQPELPRPMEEPILDAPSYEPAVAKRISADLEPFLEWATAAKLAPEKLSATEVCAKATEPSAGICTKSLVGPGIGDQMFSASYKPGVPGAVRLSVTVSYLVGCDALAPSRTLAQWQQGRSQKQLCEISSGNLGGMRLLAVRLGVGTSLFVFTPSYTAQDEVFRSAASPNG